MNVGQRLALVKERIAEACRRAGRAKGSVRLVAVSKRQSDEGLEAAYAAGHRDFGENYVQELLRKQDLLPDARFHMIGHLQTNKAKKAITAAVIHTLDSERLARALARAVGNGPKLSVLIEVNLGSEMQKAGVVPHEVEALLEQTRALEGLQLQGLMCIPPAESPGRSWFAQLRTLAESLRARTGLALPELSMGMSADFEDAVLEGATLVRVGTGVFGARRS